ncbi:unnamed protein product, partial [Mesorhabditis spiculigera]
MVSFTDNPDTGQTNVPQETPVVRNVEKVMNNQVQPQLNHPRPWCGAAGASGEKDTDNRVYRYGDREDKEKTPMCMVAELCRYHRIKHQYDLLDESGPAHKKMFTVQLVFTPTEKYEGTGGSIRKAQQAAAAVAIQETKRARPPAKKEFAKKRVSPPSVLLRHATTRLGLPDPDYKKQDCMNGLPNLAFPPKIRNPKPPRNPMFYGPAPIIGAPMNMPPQGIPPAIPALADFQPFQAPLGMPPPLFPPNPMYDIRQKPPMVAATLLLGPGHPFFRVMAPTYEMAREGCANQALIYLAPLLAELDLQQKENEKEAPKVKQDDNNHAKEEDSASEASDNDNKESNRKKKNVVSKVHEHALQLKMDVSFETISEDGPAHSRVYTVCCRVAGPNQSISAEGTGKNKRAGKQDACAQVLEKLQALALSQSPIMLAQSLYKNDKRQAQGKEVKRKTIVKDKKMDPEYGHQINPVSRLMQISQAQSLADPEFTFLREQGQNRYKEFFVACSWNGIVCDGMGPNKRLAKRAAAENVLAKIGYVKPMPTPGKSLLKKRHDESQMMIGVFDPADYSQPAEEAPGMDTSNITSDPELTKWNTIVVVPPFESEDESSEVSPEIPAAPEVPEVPEVPDAVEEEAQAEQKRKVTFSAQVKACPPPDDAAYPISEIAPLKTEDVTFVAKLSKRDRKKQRVLHPDQLQELCLRAREFLATYNYETKMAMLPSKGDLTPEGTTLFTIKPISARDRLAELSEKFKFSLQFCQLHSSGNDCLVLATLGLESQKALVHQGIGTTGDEAIDLAALDALKNLANLLEPA